MIKNKANLEWAIRNIESEINQLENEIIRLKIRRDKHVVDLKAFKSELESQQNQTNDGGVNDN
jgi:septal ring factor EnvC (AmiA/AmiB activator)